VYDAYQDTVQFNYRLFPLPYHQYAFLLAKSAFVVDAVGSQGDVFKFLDEVYQPENQAQIYNSATADLTYNQVLAVVAGFVANATDVKEADYLLAMDSSEGCGECEMNARYAFKAAALRSVYGTPMQHINGVSVDGLDTIDDWKSVLGDLEL
jgi:hypothetical protein